MQKPSLLSFSFSIFLLFQVICQNINLEDRDRVIYRDRETDRVINRDRDRDRIIYRERDRDQDRDIRFHLWIPCSRRNMYDCQQSCRRQNKRFCWCAQRRIRGFSNQNCSCAPRNAMCLRPPY